MVGDLRALYLFWLCAADDDDEDPRFAGLKSWFSMACHHYRPNQAFNHLGRQGVLSNEQPTRQGIWLAR